MTSENYPSVWSITLILIGMLVLCQAVAIGADPQDNDPIDRKRVQDLRMRMEDGEELSPEDQAYLDRARQERQKQDKPDRAAQEGGEGAKPREKKNRPPTSGMEGKASTGLIPLTEMTAEDQYKGEDGGLYGGGQNEPPEAHQAAALKELAKIIPLDAQGNPAKDGKTVLFSIGMSNTSLEFNLFKETADADPAKNPHLVIVNGAQHSRDAIAWSSQRGGERGNTWPELDDRLKQAGVTPQQVQVVWLKHDIASGNKNRGAELENARELQGHLITILNLAKARFPNLRVAYLTSRIYSGYSHTRHPEPHPYETAFAVRWTIQDQINGKLELNYDPARGEVKAPLVLWGPYIWADGITPRKSDGLVWERQEFQEGDGVHPTQLGGRKVADLLLKFFKTDPLAKTWFVKQ